MKKLDAMSESAAQESSDRAARRAERAKARQHAQENGDVSSSRSSRRAKQADEPVVEVSDQALEEMDEEALQNLVSFTFHHLFCRAYVVQAPYKHNSKQILRLITKNSEKGSSAFF